MWAFYIVAVGLLLLGIASHSRDVIVLAGTVLFITIVVHLTSAIMRDFMEGRRRWLGVVAGF
ncbi:MAG TPA: hypothetical protein DCR74_21450 [Achromobacter sp.]|nr:hypothetical protein [Achromobacter sp.]